MASVEAQEAFGLASVDIATELAGDVKSCGALFGL